MPLKGPRPAADPTCEMRSSVVVVAGFAGLLLGGPVGALFVAVVADAAVRLASVSRSGL